MKNNFSIYYKEKKDQFKVELLQTILRLLHTYNDQVLSTQGTLLEHLAKLTFTPDLCEEMIKYLTDYFDNVREQAQSIVGYIVIKFVHQDFSFSGEQQEVLNVLRSNITVGWGENMRTQVRDAADMEAELNKHLFVDPQAFLKSVIAIMIDETHGRENLINVIKEFSKKTPFMVMNDYRIAVGTNSLKRIDILKELIFNTQ